MALFGGTEMETNMVESGVECLSGVKTNYNNKKKGGIERKKNMEMSS